MLFPSYSWEVCVKHPEEFTPCSWWWRNGVHCWQKRRWNGAVRGRQEYVALVIRGHTSLRLLCGHSACPLLLTFLMCTSLFTSYVSPWKTHSRPRHWAVAMKPSSSILDASRGGRERKTKWKTGSKDKERRRLHDWERTRVSPDAAKIDKWNFVS